MAQILIDWLNNDVQLSQRIGNASSFRRATLTISLDPLESSQSLAGDFATGYLIGEILSKYGLQEDFPQFSTSKSVDRAFVRPPTLSFAAIRSLSSTTSPA